MKPITVNYVIVILTSTAALINIDSVFLWNQNYRHKTSFRILPKFIFSDNNKSESYSVETNIDRAVWPCYALHVEIASCQSAAPPPSTLTLFY